jgi:drug/metabolite transporter (DMT)-like permease
MDVAIEPADFIRLSIVGCGSFLSTVATALSLKYMSPSMFSIFQPSVPCLVAGLSMASGMEPYNTMKVIGVLFAVCGALVAELWKGSKPDETAVNTPTGVFFACVQVTSMAILLVAVKPLLNKYEPAVVTTMYFTVGTAMMFLLCLAMITTFPASAFTFGGEIMPWVALLYSAIVVGMFAFFALNWAGKHVSPTVATVYFTFQPVGTCALSAVLLGAAVTWPEVGGGVLIVCGLLVTTLAGNGGMDHGLTLTLKSCTSTEEDTIKGSLGYVNGAKVISGAESGPKESSVGGMLEMVVQTVFGRLAATGSGSTENRYQPVRTTEEWVRGAVEEEGYIDCVDIT